MDTDITINFKLKLNTEDPAALLRLLNSEPYQGMLLAKVGTAVRERLSREIEDCQVTQITLRTPRLETML